VDTQTDPWTWTVVTSGGDAAGYQTLTSRAMRWGTNTIGDSGVWFDDGFGDAFSIVTSFTASGSPSMESQAVAGDLGGAVFSKNGATWELSGLMLTAAGFSGQPDPLENAIYGDETFIADLSFYRPQIVAIVPEPSSMAILAPAVAFLTTALGRRLRSRGRTAGGGCREGSSRPVSSEATLQFPATPADLPGARPGVS